MNGTSTKTVVLADDHVIVRHAIRMILDRAGGVEVIAEAGGTDEALRLAIELSPDVLILDLNMPGRPAAEVVREVNRRRPSTAVMVLTMESDPGIASEMLAHGASGYLLKSTLEEEFLDALNDLMVGGRHVSATVERAIDRRTASVESSSPFTKRELEILKLVALGHTSGEIANQLGLSVRTIESHRTRISQKAPFDTRPELVRYALEQKLI